MTLTANKQGKQYLVPAAMINLSADDVAKRFGVKFDKYDSDGFGPALGHAFKLADGGELYFEQFVDSREQHLYVNCDHRLNGSELKGLLLNAFNALDVHPERVLWVRDELKAEVKQLLTARP